MASTMWDLIFGLAGGLGLFLLGFSLMGQGLQNIVGDRIRFFLERTSNPLTALATGFFMTLTLQEAGAATVLLIGLLGSGLIRLKQGICMMLGVNLGVTLLVHLTTLRLGSYALVAVGLGFLIYSFGKQRSSQYLGYLTLGFGLVFIGLNILTAAMKPFVEQILWQGSLPQNLLLPFSGFFLGFLMTALLQNNLATIGLLQAFVSQAALSGEGVTFLQLPVFLPFLLGTGLGVCVTASLTATKDNILIRRAVWAHWLIIGATNFGLLLLVRPLAGLVNWTTLRVSQMIGAGNEFIFSIPAGFVPSGARLLNWEIAMAHTLVNLLMVLIWLPLAAPMARFLKERIPTPWRNQEEETAGREFLDERFFTAPALALRIAAKEIMCTAQIAIDMLYLAQIAFFKGQSSAIRDIEKKEDIVDELRNKITLYLSTLLSKNILTAAQSRYLAGLIHVINDVERIADHAEHIGEFAQAKLEEKLPFSQLAMDELGLMYDKVLAICKKALSALEKDDPLLAKQVLEREVVIDKIQEEMRQNHINRLNQGRCWPGSGIIYLELIANLERVADHAANIADVALVGKEEMI